MVFYKAISKAVTGKRSVLSIFVLTAAMLVFHCGQGYAQVSGFANGTVRNAAGEPVAGVSVVLKGTSTGTTTGSDGKFSIRIDESDAPFLVFNFIGYAPQEVAAVAGAPMSITLTESEVQIGQIVVIGYGTLSRKEVSSAIVQIDSDNFHKGTGTAMELITGKVAGLSVNRTEFGNPNAGASIQVRGAASLTAGTEPLVVIDGVAAGYGDYNLRSISPMDIQSITVLKDASSAAIYGSRSANGVILVTTKEGMAGAQPRISYNGWFSVNTVANRPEVLSADEFRRSLRRNDFGASTDWYDALLRKFSYDTNHQVSLTGGTVRGRYNASLDFRRGMGLDIATGRKEYGARMAVTQKGLNDLVELNASVSARRVDEDWGDNGMFSTALTMNPTMPVYDESAQGGYYHPTSPLYVRNPVEKLKAEKRGGSRVYILGTAELKFNLLNRNGHTLNTSINYSLNYNDLNQHDWTPTTSSESVLWSDYKGRATLEYQKWWINQVEWLANYSFIRGDHSLRALLGYSFTEDNSEGRWMENRGFEYDQFEWHNMESGAALPAGNAGMSSYKDQGRLIGVFGRAVYSWRSILMGSASLRYEGATIFGADHKWGYFPAVSAAIEFANMPFMADSRDVVQSLKLRASYGVAGRSNFGKYRSLATYGALTPDQNRGWRYLIDGEWVQAFGPTKNANPDLAWERAADFNIGVDFSLYRRLRGSVDFFIKQSKDLLYNYQAAQPPFIYPDMYVNVGSIRATGVELSLEGDIFKNENFRWTSNVVFSYGKTKFDKLSGGGYYAREMWFYQLPGIGTTEHLIRAEEGGRVGHFWGYEHAGISEDGQFMVYDKNNNVIPASSANPDDKRYIGHGVPDFMYSWGNSFRYKNFDLSLFFRGAAGFQAFNLRKYQMGLMGSSTDNVLRTAYTVDKNITTANPMVLSSFYLENASYIKLEDLTLGYNIGFRSGNRYFDNIRVYFSAKNLFTLTSYTGNDPSTLNINGLAPGIDTGDAYPYARQFSLGLSITFK